MTASSAPAEASARPLAELRPDDFVAQPVWAWCLDEGGTDESSVRPCAVSTVPRGAFGSWLVAARITLRDGTVFSGCVEVTTEKGKRSRFDPLFLFLRDRQLDIVSMETERLISRYTQFPRNRAIRWQLAVPLDGETRLRAGRVSRSFLYLVVSFLLRWAMRKKTGSNRSGRR